MFGWVASFMWKNSGAVFPHLLQWVTLNKLHCWSIRTWPVSWLPHHTVGLPLNSKLLKPDSRHLEFFTPYSNRVRKMVSVLFFFSLDYQDMNDDLFNKNVINIVTKLTVKVKKYIDVCWTLTWPRPTPCCLCDSRSNIMIMDCIWYWNDVI